MSGNTEGGGGGKWAGNGEKFERFAGMAEGPEKERLFRQIVEDNLGLVYAEAGRKVSAVYEFEELVSYGSMGLMQAVRGFDPSRGRAFSSYAMPFIAGKMINGMSQMQFSVGRRKFEELQRSDPSGDGGRSEGGGVEDIAVSREPQPDAEASRRELWAKVEELTTPRQLGVLRDTYVDDMTIREIGDRDGRHHTSVCETKALGLRRLRTSDALVDAYGRAGDRRTTDAAA